MGFKDYYTKKEETEDSPENHFEYVTGVNIKSIDAFISWCILNKKINPYLVNNVTKKPISLFSLPYNKKIGYLVDNLKNIKKEAELFSQKWK